MEYSKKLWELCELIINRKRGSKGFPVAAVFFDNTKTLAKGVNKRSTTGSNDPENHAETQCLKQRVVFPETRVSLLVTLPPCRGCVKNIVKEGIKLKKVFYVAKTLATPVEEEKYIEFLKANGIRLVKVGVTNLDIENKIYYWFQRYKICETFYTLKDKDSKKNRNTVKQTVTEIAKMIYYKEKASEAVREYKLLVDQYIKMHKNGNKKTNNYILIQKLDEFMKTENLERFSEEDKSVKMQNGKY